MLCCVQHIQTLYASFRECTMSSFQIVDKPGEFPYVVFGGGYRCYSPSVVEAMAATEIQIDGIAGVVGHRWCTKTYPRGRFCCGKCGEWKVLDVENWAWAVRSSYGGCPLVFPKLMCGDCSDDETFEEGTRFAVLACEDLYVNMRYNAKKALAKFLVSRWRGNAKLRKEKREFALNSALVFREMFENRPEGWQAAWGAFIAHT